MYLGKISYSEAMRWIEIICDEMKKGESFWCWSSPFCFGYQSNILGFLGELILKISWRYQRNLWQLIFSDKSTLSQR
jgi:hypothetical protein